MKILYVLNSSKYGGMENHVLDLVREMKKRGHDIFVFCPQGEMLKKYENYGALVTEKYIKKDIDFEFIENLRKFVNEKEIDIVHSHELKAVCNSLIACRKGKVKAVVTHTHTPISEWQINPLKKFFDIKIYSHLVNKYSDAEIALTESKKKVKIKEGIKEEKLVVIPNGLDMSEFEISDEKKSEYKKEIKHKFSIPEEAFVFGNMGRITREKGHEILIKAFADFLNLKNLSEYDKKNSYLLIAGGGVLEDKIRDLAKDLEIEKNVIITGKFEDEEKIKYLSSFDIFLFPTLAEGFGIVLTESLSLGIPTVCSDLDVLKEVGDGFVSFFKTGDEKELANAMLNEYNRVRDLKKSGDFFISGAKEYVKENYSMEKFAENYEFLYKKLLEKKR